MNSPIYNSSPFPPSIGLDGGEDYSAYAGCTFVRISSPVGNTGGRVFDVAHAILIGKGYVNYNTLNTGMTSPSGVTYSVITDEYVKINDSENPIAVATEIRNSITYANVIIDTLTIGIGDAPTKSWRAMLSNSSILHDLGLVTSQYTFTDPDACRPIIHALYTSREAPLVGSLVESKYYRARTSAVYYMYRVKGGWIGATTADALFDRLELYSGEGLVTLTADFRACPVSKQYKVALIANAWVRLYGELNDSMLNMFFDDFYKFSHIANRIDPVFEHSGTDPIPVPAWDDELRSLFDAVLGNENGDNGRISI